MAVPWLGLMLQVPAHLHGLGVHARGEQQLVDGEGVTVW